MRRASNRRRRLAPLPDRSANGRSGRGATASAVTHGRGRADYAGAGVLLFKGILASLLLLTLTGCSVLGIRTTEEATHTVLQEDGRFELRKYDELLVVETSVTAGYDEAGEIAFGRLFGYSSGENADQSKIAMTAPVIAEPEGRAESVKIAMTAPVLAEEDENRWRVDVEHKS